ncbi:hypothetical protein [Thermococcus stetteri]|uniref:hypothetical protein n=1 Tax=Thermococcus stetteri TaxID=49900 RepID=UPI001FD8541D|nr:hypothetical protein [Thermococcus stetteri]MBP1912749.1 hypothetical protein [Thermococcus stetteri]
MGKLDEFFGSLTGKRSDSEVLAEIESQLAEDNVSRAIGLIEELDKEQNVVLAVRLVLRKLFKLKTDADTSSFKIIPFLKQLIPYINEIKKRALPCSSSR